MVKSSSKNLFLIFCVFVMAFFAFYQESDFVVSQNEDLDGLSGSLRDVLENLDSVVELENYIGESCSDSGTYQRKEDCYDYSEDSEFEGFVCCNEKKISCEDYCNSLAKTCEIRSSCSGEEKTNAALNLNEDEKCCVLYSSEELTSLDEEFKTLKSVIIDNPNYIKLFVTKTNISNISDVKEKYLLKINIDGDVLDGFVLEYGDFSLVVSSEFNPNELDCSNDEVNSDNEKIVCESIKFEANLYSKLQNIQLNSNTYISKLTGFASQDTSVFDSAIEDMNSLFSRGDFQDIFDDFRNSAEENRLEELNDTIDAVYLEIASLDGNDPKNDYFGDIKNCFETYSGNAFKKERVVNYLLRRDTVRLASYIDLPDRPDLTYDNYKFDLYCRVLNREFLEGLVENMQLTSVEEEISTIMTSLSYENAIRELLNFQDDERVCVYGDFCLDSEYVVDSSSENWLKETWNAISSTSIFFFSMIPNIFDSEGSFLASLARNYVAFGDLDDFPASNGFEAFYEFESSVGSSSYGSYEEFLKEEFFSGDADAADAFIKIEDILIGERTPIHGLTLSLLNEGVNLIRDSEMMNSLDGFFDFFDTATEVTEDFSSSNSAAESVCDLMGFAKGVNELENKFDLKDSSIVAYIPNAWFSSSTMNNGDTRYTYYLSPFLKIGKITSGSSGKYSYLQNLSIDGGETTRLCLKNNEDDINFCYSPTSETYFELGEVAESKFCMKYGFDDELDSYCFPTASEGEEALIFKNYTNTFCFETSSVNSPNFCFEKGEDKVYEDEDGYISFERVIEVDEDFDQSENLGMKLNFFYVEDGLIKRFEQVNPKFFLDGSNRYVETSKVSTLLSQNVLGKNQKKPMIHISQAVSDSYESHFYNYVCLSFNLSLTELEKGNIVASEYESYDVESSFDSINKRFCKKIVSPTYDEEALVMYLDEKMNPRNEDTDSEDSSTVDSGESGTDGGDSGDLESPEETCDCSKEIVEECYEACGLAVVE